MTETYPVYEEGPRRRGRRLLVVLLVVLAVLAGLLAVADRVAAGAAERAIAQRAQSEIAKQHISSSKPDVSIGGFPFLTQVAAGRYQSISISVRDAEGKIEDKTVRMPRLRIVSRDVHAPLRALRSGQGQIRARSVDGTGVIAYASVAQFIDRPGVRLAERDGKLVVTAPVDILGQKFDVTGTGDLTVANGEVRVRFEDLSAQGLPNIPMARALLAQFASQISIRVPLPELPYGLRVHSVRPLPEGLELTAGATDVPLNAA